jgi:hypothetical protein
MIAVIGFVLRALRMADQLELPRGAKDRVGRPAL